MRCAGAGRIGSASFPCFADTIAAISTATGEAAISVIRLSGPKALALAAKAFKLPAKVVPRRAHLVQVLDENGAGLDSGVLLHFQGPASYTGEDVIEFHGHGGVLVTQRVLERVLASGARAAEPGEFTQRAFLNGKMDLTQGGGRDGSHSRPKHAGSACCE